VRTFKPDPVPKEDLQLIVEAAVKAPNGGERQVGRLLLVTADSAKIRQKSDRLAQICPFNADHVIEVRKTALSLSARIFSLQ
jgi:nitroreductase